MVYKKNLPPQLANYEMVEDRLKRFWEKCPNGRIDTEIVQVLMDGAMIMVKAYLYESKDDANPVATGIAMDWKGKGNNMSTKTNWCETSETSAIGRAIANSRYQDPKAQRPSREEMKIALGRQENPNTNEPTKVEIKEEVKEVKEPQKTPSQNHSEEQKTVPPSDLKEVEFRNFCEELVKSGEMDEKFRERFFKYIDLNVKSEGMVGVELAIAESKEMGFDFKSSVSEPVKEQPKAVQSNVKQWWSDGSEFDNISIFIDDCKSRWVDEMRKLNPDAKDKELELQYAYVINQTLKVGKGSYQEGLDYWNKWCRKQPYIIEKQEIPTPIESGHLDITNMDIVQPEDLPSIMEEMGATEVQKFEEFPKLVKKVTYKNPDYQSSRKQQDLILKCCKFRNITPERLQAYLKQELNSSLTDLTIQEASWLIDGFFNEKKY